MDSDNINNENMNNNIEEKDIIDSIVDSSDDFDFIERDKLYCTVNGTMIIQFIKFDAETELFLITKKYTNKNIEQEEWVSQKDIQHLLKNIDYNHLKLTLPQPVSPYHPCRTLKSSSRTLQST